MTPRDTARHRETPRDTDISTLGNDRSKNGAVSACGNCVASRIVTHRHASSRIVTHIPVASRCVMLRRAASCCVMLRHAASCCVALRHVASRCVALRRVASCCVAIHDGSAICPRFVRDLSAIFPRYFQPRPRDPRYFDARRDFGESRLFLTQSATGGRQQYSLEYSSQAEAHCRRRPAERICFRRPDR